MNELPEWFKISHKDALFSAKEVAEIIGVKEKRLYHMIDKAMFPPSDSTKKIYTNAKKHHAFAWKKQTILNWLKTKAA